MSENSNTPLLIGGALLAAGIAYFLFEGDSSASPANPAQPPAQPPPVINPPTAKAKANGFYLTQKEPNGTISKLGATIAPEKYNAQYQTDTMKMLSALWKTEVIGAGGSKDGLYQAWGHFTFPGGQPELPVLVGQQFYKYADLIKQ